ncbi:MAG: oxygen-independent coproporphyrinogen III oxidase [Gammaproteobacteria bacterium]|jgi:oxygen-independent coproporphyrinogen-3 oxidase|nr:oxygen-independent coproporphyrinogen III oxidase [Gammaproteobacteria bacterium]MBT3858443.1 oxygen-independent coproporphyrinogen III oxidase [Gammaproteobacteria bacterium]MBT3986819.1 oxygen-independent coproporphyrinogen III oxidase [Gammaproteobacteria bacterium]MBT4256980.1 oxygen-independent coproporphyrinogen III oxidase [Gammaproteobacteria bacterium]MBT4581199.1 oxygen-independent coproporphyrinogen III oxidase [Gammaproteobacteria bacterium]
MSETQNKPVPFDAELLRKYDTFGPRYTSYPTALQFSPDFAENEYIEEIAQSNSDGGPLSLYFHIPFCESLCFYCACNKIITHTHDRAIPYLERLHKEVSMQAALIDDQRQVNQLHFGGGTPTFLSDEQLNNLMRVTGEHFNLAPLDEREFSIEVDPRAVRENTVSILSEFGFNRISLGVQDFDETVQKAVNRLQSVEQTQAVVDAARRSGYQSISMDLIYGLPHQTTQSFSETLDKVISMGPERMAVYNYAHLPHRVKAQKLIKEEDLPDAVTKLGLLELTINRLQQAGYVYIGMDHFALPNDELVLAKNNGSLQRNFQGYSTHADADMIGMGVTSIGKTGNSYSQNERFEHAYFDAIDNDRMAVFQGYRLNQDDRLRRKLIQDLMCQGLVDYSRIENLFGINFENYFAAELDQLVIMEEDGLLEVCNRQIVVQPLGRLLLRNIAMAFDAYHQQARKKLQFSRAI